MTSPTITIVETRPTITVTEDGTTITAVGIQGPQGPAGGGMSWQGAWDSATSYAIDDAVGYQGSTYIATTANTNDAPPGTSWDLFVAKGDTGATGPAGADGADGAPGPQGPAGADGAPGPSGTTAATTAGDLLVHDGTAVDRLPIGSAGQVLTVAGGLPAWEDAASGGGASQQPLALPWSSGRWYDVSSSLPMASAGATTNPQINTLYGVPIYVPGPVTIDRIAITVTSAAAAGSVARLGIYDTGADGLPGALVADFGTVATDSTGDKSIVIAQDLAAGWYWLAILPNTTFGLRTYANNSRATFLGATTTFSAPRLVTPTRATSYGPLPSTFGAPSAYTANGFDIEVRRS